MNRFLLSLSRIINRALRGFVRLYQLTISPLFSVFDNVGGGCRYQPTCSQYCLDALAEHGNAHGLWLSLKRIGRCAPWGSFGYDPVPPRTSFRVPRPL